MHVSVQDSDKCEKSERYDRCVVQEERSLILHYKQKRMNKWYYGHIKFSLEAGKHHF